MITGTSSWATTTSGGTRPPRRLLVLATSLPITWLAHATLARWQEAYSSLLATSLR